VLGDVNAGAEVVAEGSILVWGRVRGSVHAGAKGDQTAAVYGLDLSAGQIRIVDDINIQSMTDREPQPEKISLVNGVLLAEAWQPNQS